MTSKHKGELDIINSQPEFLMKQTSKKNGMLEKTTNMDRPESPGTQFRISFPELWKFSFAEELQWLFRIYEKPVGQSYHHFNPEQHCNIANGNIEPQWEECILH